MTSLHTARQRSELAIDRLVMPDQRLDTTFTDPAAPVQPQQENMQSRLVLLLVPLVLCGLLFSLLARPMWDAGPLPLGGMLLCCAVLIPFYWDAVASTLSLLGWFWKAKDREAEVNPLRIAILVLLYDEPSEPVLERAVQLLASLGHSKDHSFSLHILSDSRQLTSVQRERAVFEAHRHRHGNLAMYYVHRVVNVDHKSGNIRSWIRSAGEHYDAMLVLDADSAMEATSILDMADTLATDEACALVQTIPRVLPGRTLWQEMQSFASNTYGVNLGKGLALVSGGTANYYGHNALIRIKAFAESAGLPHLQGLPPFGGLIMSHDFVEAALLRRAGWQVRFLPDVTGSYEETPETVEGYLRRDQRWCHGNLQHLRLLNVPGLDMMSRFHFLQGAMVYLAAPLWLLAIALWTFAPITVEAGQLFWPLLLIGFVLLLPRLCGLMASWNSLSRRDFGRAAQELLVSTVLAPVLMVQRARMILGIVLGRPAVWRKVVDAQSTWSARLRFHAVEIALGHLLLASWIFGFAPSPVLVVALALLLAPVLTRMVSVQQSKSREANS